MSALIVTVSTYVPTRMVVTYALVLMDIHWMKMEEIVLVYDAQYVVIVQILWLI